MASEEPLAQGGQVAALPARVRRVLIEFAAEALGTLPEAELPIGLRKIRGFAPARRARSGSTPLALALDREPGFRRQVASLWRVRNPELAAVVETAITQTDDVVSTDPMLAAVGTYLCRPEGWQSQLSRAAGTPPR